MGKVLDITDKLSFEENPKLKIKGVEYEVNCDAPSMLKIMQLIGDGGDISPNDLVKMYELIIPEKERKKIDKLKLNFKDFKTLVMSGIGLITGSDDDLGE